MMGSLEGKWWLLDLKASVLWASVWYLCEIFWGGGVRILGGGNSNIFDFHPDPCKDDPIRRAYFSNGLVQAPTSIPQDPPKKCFYCGVFNFQSSKHSLFCQNLFVSIVDVTSWNLQRGDFFSFSESGPKETGEHGPGAPGGAPLASEKRCEAEAKNLWTIYTGCEH